jgi:hypothetical protein
MLVGPRRLNPFVYCPLVIGPDVDRGTLFGGQAPTPDARRNRQICRCHRLGAGRMSVITGGVGRVWRVRAGGRWVGGLGRVCQMGRDPRPPLTHSHSRTKDDGPIRT